MQARQPAFRLLGPLEVWAEGSPLRLGGERQRALLALLLLHANEVVPSDRLIEQLFGLDAPDTAANALQVAVSRLRRLLGDGVLVTRPRGYLLQIDPEQLDAALFDRLLADGRRSLADGDATAAAATLREGLALWRGPPLADLAPVEALQPDIRRLQELHLAAQMDRIDADIALGGGAELVPELEALVDTDPLQERLRGQLMLALYRSGRQADALEAYRRTRELLSDELGLQPSPALQLLERQILNHDPGLDRPENGVPAIAEAAPEHPAAATPRRRRRTAWIVAACAVLLAIAAAAFVSARALGSEHGLRGVGPDAIGVIDPHGDGRITAQLPLGARPVGAAFGSGAFWVSASNGTLTRVEPDKLGAFTTVPLGGSPGAVTVGGGAVWVADEDTGFVSRIDPAVRQSVDKIRVGNGPSAAIWCARSVWIANQTDGTLSRIDPHTDEASPPIPVGSAPSGLACDGGSLWVADAQDGTVTRIDARTNQPTMSRTVGAGPAAIAAGLGAVWVASSLDGTVSRVDRITGSTTAIPVGRGVDALAIADGSVWAGDSGAGTVARIDPDAARVVSRVHLGSSPASLVTAGERLVVATHASPATHRGGTLVVAAEKELTPETLDPATWGGALATSLLGVTNDGLVTFRRVGGSGGLVVVPDLAGSLPVITGGGAVQTFVLRPGLRYSDGRPVRARDVRASIERFWKLNPDAPGGYPEIRLGVAGETACIADPRHCDLSRGIVSADRARTITFHLVRPRAAFLRVLALPFFDLLPAETPVRRGRRVLPATGPYRITGYKPGHRIVLERNPRFHAAPISAQPAGFPDRIVFRIGLPSERALDDVLAGRADYLSVWSPLTSAQLAQLVTHRASQLHSVQHIGQGFNYLFLDTRTPPFDRRDARAALNYAVDRREIARLAGGALVSDPTCQVIPIGFPGYTPYCPYTLRPNELGTWSEPDLDRAKALVRRSGTRGMKVVVWTGTSKSRYGQSLPPKARYIARVLDEIGYDASVQTLHLRKFYPLAFSPHSPIHVGVFGWSTVIPDTASVVRPLLGCSEFNNLSRLCDARVEKLMRRAELLEVTDKAAANRLWGAIDRRLVDDAPWVPLDSPRWTDVVSPRLGNYQSGPALGFLVDQAWVR